MMMAVVAMMAMVAMVAMVVVVAAAVAWPVNRGPRTVPIPNVEWAPTRPSPLPHCAAILLRACDAHSQVVRELCPGYC